MGSARVTAMKNRHEVFCLALLKERRCKDSDNNRRDRVGLV